MQRKRRQQMQRQCDKAFSVMSTKTPKKNDNKVSKRKTCNWWERVKRGAIARSPSWLSQKKGKLVKTQDTRTCGCTDTQIYAHSRICCMHRVVFLLLFDFLFFIFGIGGPTPTKLKPHHDFGYDRGIRNSNAIHAASDCIIATTARRSSNLQSASVVI